MTWRISLENLTALRLNHGHSSSVSHLFKSSTSCGTFATCATEVPPAPSDFDPGPHLPLVCKEHFVFVDRTTLIAVTAVTAKRGWASLPLDVSLPSGTHHGYQAEAIERPAAPRDFQVEKSQQLWCKFAVLKLYLRTNWEQLVKLICAWWEFSLHTFGDRSRILSSMQINQHSSLINIPYPSQGSMSICSRIGRLGGAGLKFTTNPPHLQ